MLLWLPPGDTSAVEPSFTVLDLYPTAVSADGSVVVGRSAFYGSNAVRWTAAGGAVVLGHLKGDEVNDLGQKLIDTMSLALGVSADGSVVVGATTFYYEDDSFDQRAFRWTAQGGMVGLGRVPGYKSSASAVSADGSVVVGQWPPFRWTAQEGLTSLGELPGGFTEVYAMSEAVSADGTVVVGYSQIHPPTSPDDSRYVSFRWTAQTGRVVFDPWPGHRIDVADLSADGSTIVGSAEGKAFAWTSGRTIDLGTLPGHVVHYAAGISADGSVIVGGARRTSGGFIDDAFVWTEGDGMRSLRSILADSGVDVTQWRFKTVGGISDDGLTIFGTGYLDAPPWQEVGWIATIPEPTLLAFIAAAALLLDRRARPKR